MKNSETNDIQSHSRNTVLGEVSSFNVVTYSLLGGVKYCHWSEGLNMIIEKNGVTIKLNSEEIQQIVKSLPRTIGGRYQKFRITLKGLVLRGLCAKFFKPRKTKPVLYAVRFTEIINNKILKKWNLLKNTTGQMNRD